MSGTIPADERAENMGWYDLIKDVHYAIEYGVNCNDLSSHELAENIEVALDRFAKQNGLPVHDWETGYEDQFGEHTDDD